MSCALRWPDASGSWRAGAEGIELRQVHASGRKEAILGEAEKTIKVHLGHIIEKPGLDNRHAAMLIALETLGAECG